jgi:hypothetical protein
MERYIKVMKEELKREEINNKHMGNKIENMKMDYDAFLEEYQVAKETLMNNLKDTEKALY